MTGSLKAAARKEYSASQRRPIPDVPYLVLQNTEPERGFGHSRKDCTSNANPNAPTVLGHFDLVLPSLSRLKLEHTIPSNILPRVLLPRKITVCSLYYTASIFHRFTPRSSHFLEFASYSQPRLVHARGTRQSGLSPRVDDAHLRLARSTRRTASTYGYENTRRLLRMLSTVSIYQSGDSTAIDAEIVLHEAVNGAARWVQ